MLNALLNEERALVSAEAGTTRDTVEDFLTIDGIRFRFIDTAGIRDTSNQVEMMGIARSFERAKEAHLVLYVIDVTTAETPLDDLKSQLTKSGLSEANILVVWNKCDSEDDALTFGSDEFDSIAISAKKRRNLDDLKARIVSRTLQGAVNEQSGILTNSRHYQLLQAALKELYIVEEELERGSSQDLLAISLKGVIQHLGEISGSVTNDDILGSIFSSFCIGK